MLAAQEPADRSRSRVVLSCETSGRSAMLPCSFQPPPSSTLQLFMPQNGAASLRSPRQVRSGRMCCMSWMSSSEAYSQTSMHGKLLSSDAPACASGYNNIDVEAAAACGIPVTNGPGVNSASVAEAALMSILMIARRVRNLAEQASKSQCLSFVRLVWLVGSVASHSRPTSSQLAFPLPSQVVEQQETFRRQGIGFPLGTQLAGKTLGIIGMGNIGVAASCMHVRKVNASCSGLRLRSWYSGKRLARSAAALDMVVMGITSSSSRADLEAVLRIADVISIHCPLTPATRNLIGCAANL